jgi:hypothetical protein
MFVTEARVESAASMLASWICTVPFENVFGGMYGAVGVYSRTYPWGVTK